MNSVRLLGLLEEFHQIEQKFLEHKLRMQKVFLIVKIGITISVLYIISEFLINSELGFLGVFVLIFLMSMWICLYKYHTDRGEEFRKDLARFHLTLSGLSTKSEQD